MARARRWRPDRVRIDSFDDVDLDDALDPDDGLDIDPGPYQPPAPTRATPSAPQLTWQERLASVDAAMRMPAAPGARPWPAGREIQYVVEAHTSARARGLTLAVVYRERRRDGTWSKPKPANLDPSAYVCYPTWPTGGSSPFWKARPISIASGIRDTGRPSDATFCRRRRWRRCSR